MDFESIDQAKKLEDLYNEAISSGANFDDSSKILESILMTFRNYVDSKKRDTERIIIISQYPLVKNYIRRTLQETGHVSAAKMPFQKNVSLLFLRLYSESTQNVAYDDDLEEIRNDEMH